MMESAEELDSRLCWILNGEHRVPPPPYSTSPKVSRRLIRRLKEMDFEVTFEESAGLWYCCLRLNGDRVASGSDNTQELALARAVGNYSRWPSVPPAVRRPRTFRNPARPNRGGRVPVTCQKCGEEFAAIKTAKLTPLCTVCNWRRLTDARMEKRIAWPPSTDVWERGQKKGTRR